MSSRPLNPITAVIGAWDRLHQLPGGTWLFSRLLGLTVPYTGTIGAHVRELRPGFARVTLRDRRRVRNHLKSVHALALANLGEVTSGLGMLAALSANVRGIPVSLSIEFVKKGRGTLTAISTSSPPTLVTGPTELDVETLITDATQELVARTTVRWLLSPVTP